MKGLLEICESYRRKGFACSESVGRTLNDFYGLGYSDEVLKEMSAFAGGATDDGRCGVLEAGLLAMSTLFDKGYFRDEYTLMSLTIELHETFSNFYGGYQCREIFYPLMEKHNLKGLADSEFSCAFHSGIYLVFNVFEKHKKIQGEKI